MKDIYRYLGRPDQLWGAEESRLVGGRGDGMRLLTVNNGAGMLLTISEDRAADISRLSYKGVNLGYFGPSGYVAPAYYSGESGIGFTKCFTAGFLTTCGLTAVGSSCEDEGEKTHVHGTLMHIPAERVNVVAGNDSIKVTAEIRDAALFGVKYLMVREYDIPVMGGGFTITDRITNIGSKTQPLMTLYHFNMGYPLLSPSAKVAIPSNKVTPRTPRAAEGTGRELVMEEPQRGFTEQCYYHDVIRDEKGIASAGIFNPDCGVGVKLSWDAVPLDYFTEWKMMGEQEYVLGLEPGNCHPDGRDVMRRQGRLRFLDPGETAVHRIRVAMLESEDQLPGR